MSDNDNTNGLVESLDELTEDGVYRYTHAEPGDDTATFTVDMRFAHDAPGDNEPTVGLNFRDGFCSDTPTSNVRERIDDEKIERIGTEESA